MATTPSPGTAPTPNAFCTHDHIQNLQSITGKEVFVAQSKFTKLRALKTYAQALKIRKYRFAYFINCLFDPKWIETAKISIVHVPRNKSSSVKRGFRHDMTLDFEKQKLNKDGELVKDEIISGDEKMELLAAMKKIP